MTLTLSEGVTFKSSSGAFMQPIPLPTAVCLFGSTLGLLGR